MSSDAQLTANQANAQLSTGPVTPEGKLRSARNALSHGLFSAGDFVRPAEAALYAQFRTAYEADLAPVGPLEHSAAAEIIHAAWKLRRCSQLEADFDQPDDPLNDQVASRQQATIDRVRTHATRLLYRNVAELRRLQTERQLHRETPLDRATPHLASLKDISAVRLTDARRRAIESDIAAEPEETPDPFQLDPRDPDPAATAFLKMMHAQRSAPAPQPPAPAAKPGRNKPCPCGSGVKYKYCCLDKRPSLIPEAA